MFEEMSIEGVEEMPIEEVEQRPIERVEELPQLLFANEDVTVKQLIVGYADKGSACGSVTLISIKDYNVLVDCGLPSTDLSYISSSTSINCVIITHWHSDHCGRLSDFLDVRERILPDDEESNFKFDEGANLELLKLGGHSLVDLVLLVRPDSTTDKLIVVAGDLFENKTDYFSEEPYVKGIDHERLIESRKHIRSLNPSIVVPGHGPAFRLRPSFSLNESRFGEVVLCPLVVRTPVHDSVWLLSTNDYRILVNTCDNLQLPGENKLNAIVILRPSSRSVSYLGRFKADIIYMGEDVLRYPDLYSTIQEVQNEWLVDGLIQILPGPQPATLKIQIWDPKNKQVLHVIDH